MLLCPISELENTIAARPDFTRDICRLRMVQQQQQAHHTVRVSCATQAEHCCPCRLEISRDHKASGFGGSKSFFLVYLQKLGAANWEATHTPQETTHQIAKTIRPYLSPFHPVSTASGQTKNSEPTNKARYDSSSREREREQEEMVGPF